MVVSGVFNTFRNCMCHFKANLVSYRTIHETNSNVNKNVIKAKMNEIGKICTKEM
jgi:hypothetical protein